MLTAEEIKIKKARIVQLKKEIDIKRKEADYYKAMQLALKKTINSAYGALANQHFVCSCNDIAGTITAHGRDVIQYMLNYIEHYFYYDWHNDIETHQILGTEYIGKKDNKFGFYDKKLRSTGRQYDTIEDLIGTRKISFTRLEKIENIENSDNIEFVYKYHIFDIEKVNPIDSNPIFTKEGDDDYEGFIAYKGKNPMVMYGDTDSLYISYNPIMKSCNYNGDELEFILHMDAVIIKKMFDKKLNDYADMYHVKNLHDFELETISKSILFIEKKNYLKNIVWDDGVFHEDLSYFSPTGLEIVKSSTPVFVRERIYDVINYMFSNPDNVSQYKIQSILKNLKKDFEWKAYEDIDAIAMTTSCSNYNNKVIDDTSNYIVAQGAHFGVKASAFYNYLLNKNSKYKTKYDLIKSGRVKYYYCVHPLNNVFAYIRSYHPKEIVEKEGVIIDIDLQFEKTVLTIVNRFMKPMGFSPLNKKLGFFVSLFNFDED